jgi:transposase InsO family protein
MSRENLLWGAPRIHGELLKLGFEIAESTVSKYMARRSGPPSQTWRTFLRNHADAITAIDLCLVPTVTFECLFAFVVMGHGRRQLLWFAVTRHPTAEWLARQIVEAFPWNTAPRYLVRDNDGAYGKTFTKRVRTMGIRDRPIAPRSPWQNPYVERLIGTLRRECLDHVLITGERHLRRILAAYSSPIGDDSSNIKEARTVAPSKNSYCTAGNGAHESGGRAPSRLPRMGVYSKLALVPVVTNLKARAGVRQPSAGDMMGRLHI